MPKNVLTLRDLSRATLARQLLLERKKSPLATVVEQTAGLQAQLARPPYIGLWSRVAGFTRDHLTRSLDKRELIRATMMRATIHIVTAKDYVHFRSTLQPMLDKALRGPLRDRYDKLDMDRAVALGRAFFAEPRTFDDLRKKLVADDPGCDERAIAYSVRCKVPLAMVLSPDSEWGFHGAGEFVVSDIWLKTAVKPDTDLPGFVLRYLAAFGPATVADAQNWSGFSGLAPVFEELRPQLKTFASERGRELFDLPRAPRPDPETTVPIRFLPEFDNALLGHEDRNRIIADEHRPIVSTGNLQMLPTFLIDGFVAGTWKIARTKKKATIELSPFAKLAKRLRDELTAEATTLLRFVEPAAGTYDVKL